MNFPRPLYFVAAVLGIASTYFTFFTLSPFSMGLGIFLGFLAFATYCWATTIEKIR